MLRSGSPWGWSPWLPFLLNMDHIVLFLIYLTILDYILDAVKAKLWRLRPSGRLLIFYCTRQLSWLNSNSKFTRFCAGTAEISVHNWVSQFFHWIYSWENPSSENVLSLRQVYKQDLEPSLHGFLLSGISSFTFQLLRKPQILYSDFSTSKNIDFYLNFSQFTFAWGLPVGKKMWKWETHSMLFLSAKCPSVFPLSAWVWPLPGPLHSLFSEFIIVICQRDNLLQGILWLWEVELSDDIKFKLV